MKKTPSSNRVDKKPWQQLQQLQKKMAARHLRDLFSEDLGRFTRFSLNAVGLLFDYSKNAIDAEIIAALVDLARDCALESKREALFAGKKINTTEDRAVQHMALRNLTARSMQANGHDVMPEIRAVRAQMRTWVERILQGTSTGFSGLRMTDVVNIGIGGSDLGPAFVSAALKPYHTGALRAHFISNIDPTGIRQTLATLDPARTFFIVASKSGTTQETLVNADIAKAWVNEAAGWDAFSKQMVVVTANVEVAKARFGVASEQILPLWDWVGGRFSVWSAVGLVIALLIGMEGFEQLLAGAFAMDAHFQTAPLEENMPVVLGLLGVWYSNFWGAETQAVLPYDENLALLPAYLQQSHMESLGKRVNQEGETLHYPTGTILWGGVGTNSQHAFHQLLMQSERWVPIDFILALEGPLDTARERAPLIAHCLAQSRVLMHGLLEPEIVEELIAQGFSQEKARAVAPHRVIPGNRPSNLLLLPRLTPYTLGALLALYEHKIFVQSVIWDINAFDQWGVERGKVQAKSILADLMAREVHTDLDASTRGVMEFLFSSQ